MHRIFRVKAYEKEHGPHFNEEYARKAVMKMENEDGTRGPHWSLEETTTLASQYGIALGSKFNRYDWFVALNMVYSDYYRVIMNITGSNNTKHYVEFAKAWLNDKDIDEGKMWYYYIYVMCDHIREAEMECYEEKMSKYEDEEEDFGHYRRGGRRMGMFGRRSMYDKDDYENQLSVCNQTNNLVNTMNSNTLSLRDNNTANTQSIIAKLDAMQNQALLDKIDALREKNSTLISQLSNEHQTAAVGTMINQATAPIVTRLNTLQSDVDGIKCKLPNTVSVPYPQLSVYNPEIFRAAAYGAFAGDTYANYGLSSQCGC